MGFKSKLKKLRNSKSETKLSQNYIITTAENNNSSVHSMVLYENKHVSIISDACAECYNSSKDKSYIEDLNYIKRRIKDGHESILDHGNVVILLNTSMTNLSDVIEITTLCKYLNVRSIFINNDVYVLMSGGIRGYKYLFRNIKNMKNTCLSSIKMSLYNLPKEYFRDFIDAGIMKEISFIKTVEEDYTEPQPIYVSDELDIVNVDSISLIVNKLKEMDLYGEGKFELEDILNMATVTIHYKKVSRIISQQIERHQGGITQLSQRYVDYSKEPFNEFLSPDIFKPELYDSEKKYTITLKDSEYGNVAITDNLRELGKNIIGIYPQLRDQGLLKEDARAFLPNNAVTSFYMTYTIRNLIHTIILRTDKATQIETQKLFNIIKDYTLTEKGYTFNDLQKFQLPRYERDAIGDYSEIDEEIE